MKTLKLLIAFLATLLLLSFASCSNDDTTPTPKEPKKLVETVTIGNGDVTLYTSSYEYNSDYSVKKVTWKEENDAPVTINFEYTSTKITTTISNVAEPVVFNLTNGIITSFTMGTNTTPVGYNAETKTYIINGGTSFKFDGDGDFVQAGDLSVQYTTSGKGAMYLVPNLMNYKIICALAGNMYDSVYAVSHKPIAVISPSNDLSLICTNTFQEDYVTKAVLTDGSNSAIFDYTYKVE